MITEECGKMTHFDVTVRCPYCDKDTPVSMEDYLTRMTQCIHCQEFVIIDRTSEELL